MKKPLLLAVIAFPALVPAQTNGLLFDGVDDRALVPNTALNTIGEGDFTIEAWVKADETLQSSHPRMVSNQATLGVGFMFFFHDLWGGSAHKMLGVQMEGTNYILIDNGLYNGNILDGTCHHVAVAREVDTLHFFVDGSWIGDRQLFTAVPTAASTSPTMQLGLDPGNANGYNGELSQLRIWDRARAASEILADMSWSIDGNTPGLLGYWELNDGSGQTIVDRTGTANGFIGATASPEAQDPAWSSGGCAVSGVGIEETGTSGSSLWPSPAHDVITIALGPGEKATSITLCDALGNVVREERPRAFASTTINIADLPTGLYFATVRSNGNTRTLRFAKE